MHVAATLIFDSASVQTPEGGIDIDLIRAYVSARLDRIPRYRQLVAYTPVYRRPVWIDDEHFNIHYHVRHTSLPRPGTERQLKRLSGRIFSQQLDRTKPLWEFWVVEGLDGGRRFAIITKLHHSMVDGVSGVDLMWALLTPEPQVEFSEAPPFRPRHAPSTLQLLRDEMVWRAGAPFRVLESITRPVDQLGYLVNRVAEGVRAVSDLLGAGLQTTSNTPLNPMIGPHRRFDWVRIELDRAKEVKNRLGGTVNDVVLTITAGAVRRFLEHRRIWVDPIRFRALTPVSVRSGDELGTLGNRVSAWFVDLPIAERDPAKCFATIQKATAQLKERNHALGADVLTQATEWTGSTLLSLGFRLVSRLRPFNLIVTNVPGPQVPLYLLESEMLATYPQGPLFTNQALGVALFSYAGWLCWGFNSSWDLLPDLHDFVQAIGESFRDLEKAAGVGSTVPRVSELRAVATPGPGAHA
jgi:WS/DGAT/MGAT family acyltransferase